MKLQGSGGCEFGSNFRIQLPEIECTMVAQDLDPSAFVLTKRPNDSYRAYLGTGRYYDYEVDTGEESFTVTYANDAGFLAFFLHACVTPDASENPPNSFEPRSKQQNHSSLLDRMARWLKPHL